MSSSEFQRPTMASMRGQSVVKGPKRYLVCWGHHPTASDGQHARTESSEGFKGITWCAGAITREDRPQVPSSPVASGGLPRGVNACRQLRRDLLLHVVSEHGEDLLYKGIQLLLEQQSWVFGFHLLQHDCGCSQGPA